MATEFPQVQMSGLQDLGARLLERRKPGTDLKVLARDLLRGFFDVCTYAGLDRILDVLAAPDHLPERATFADSETAVPALVAQLEAIDLDGGSPRNLKPRQLADCVIAALGLAVVEEPDTRTELGDDVRTAVRAALATAIDGELAEAKLRDAIIADARARCDASYHAAFNKIVAQLDARGMQLVKQPKVPIDAMQAVSRALAEARDAVIERPAQIAIDRAKAVLERTDAAVAARIDQPVTLRATPREVAILRACDARVAKTPAGVVGALLDGLTELARIKWRAPAQAVHVYAASKTFAVGDMIEHPKFGRGTVAGGHDRYIDVEFADGKHTLVHVPVRR